MSKESFLSYFVLQFKSLETLRDLCFLLFRFRRYSSSRSRSPTARNKNLVELTKRELSLSPPPSPNRSNGKVGANVLSKLHIPGYCDLINQ